MRRSPIGASSASSAMNLPFSIEELLRFVASHPGLKDLEMLGVFANRGERDLMGTEGAFNRDSIHFFRTGPPLGRAQDDHGPDWLLLEPALRASCWMARISA